MKKIPLTKAERARLAKEKSLALNAETGTVNADSATVPNAVPEEKTSTAPETEQTPIAGTESQKIITVTFQAYTTEARAWIENPESIPGTNFAPCMWIGQKSANRIAGIMGRPIELGEAMGLVVPDGAEAECTLDMVKFQPVRFIADVPADLEEQIFDRNRPLLECFKFNGCYYLNSISLELEVYSGSVYKRVSDGNTKWFTHCKSSALWKIWSAASKLARKDQWGLPLDAILKKQEVWRRERQQVLLLQRLASNVARREEEHLADSLGRGSDGFNRGHNRQRR